MEKKTAIARYLEQKRPKQNAFILYSSRKKKHALSLGVIIPRVRPCQVHGGFYRACEFDDGAGRLALIWLVPRSRYTHTRIIIIYFLVFILALVERN